MKTPAAARLVVLLTALALVVLAIGCGGAGAPIGKDGDTQATAVPPEPSQPALSAPDATAPDGANTVVVPAQVLDVRIDVAESDPPQYFARVTSGLSSSCVEHEGYELTDEGYSVEIMVYSRQPSPAAQVMCADVYREHETSVHLGSDFESGREYTVTVNDKVTTFVAE